MEQLDAARDALLDSDDALVGRIKDVKEAEKRLRHSLLSCNAWRLIPFFKLFMSAPKDELHQWYVLCCHMYTLLYTCICRICQQQRKASGYQRQTGGSVKKVG